MSSYGNISYTYEYSTDGQTWVRATTTSALTHDITVPSGVTQLQARVLAQDDIGFTSSTYVYSNVATVSPPTYLAIYPESGDIGTLVNDVEFYIESDYVDSAEVTITVGALTQTITATVGTVYSINILDILVGSGEITITAQAEVNGIVTSEVSTLVYEKAAVTFPSDNVNVGVISSGDIKTYPLSTAEAIRVPGGETLDVVLNDILTRLDGSDSSTIREEKFLTDYYDIDGTNPYTQSVSLTGEDGSVINILIDFDSWSTADLANLFGMGTNPAAWDANDIGLHVYIRTGTDAYYLVLHVCDNNPIVVTTSTGTSGHHKMVIKLVCGSTSTVSMWYDGSLIYSGTGDATVSGSWLISNAEGTNRFMGIYREISLLKSTLTDDQLLNASSLDD